MKTKFFFLFFLFPLFLFSQDEEDPCVQKFDKKIEKEYDRARSFQREGKRKEAIEIYHEILENYPDYLEVNYQLAMLYYRPIELANMRITDKKPAQEAIRLFDKIYQICPHYKILSNLYAARLSYLLEQFPDAIKFAKILTDNPDLIKEIENIEEAEVIIGRAKFYGEILKNPVPFDPKPVKGISTGDDEYLATISPDDEFIYFTRRKMVKDDAVFSDEYIEKELFCISQRGESGEFGIGEPLPHPFNQSYKEGSPSINLNNDFLIFTRVISGQIGGNPYPNYDLFYSEFIIDSWGAPQNFGNNVNRSDSWDSQASLSSDGKVMFFASDRPGGYGGADIWFSEKNADGTWRKPQNLGPVINTSGNERSPFLHTDSKTLYFSSSGHPGLGGMDIFYSKLDDKNRWQKPINIGYPINSENDEVDFFVSLDGKRAFFSSNNLDSKDWNIYEFELYEAARPRSMILVKGEVKSEIGEFVDAVVEIRDTASNVIATVKVNENTGKYALAAEVDKTRPQDLILNVKKEGHSYDTKLITREQIEKSVIKKDAEVKKVEVGKTYQLNDIYFETNSYALTRQSKYLIDLFVEFLKDNPSVKVEIQGHTDDIGNDDNNQILSENRAKSVYNYVIEKKIDPLRLRYKGYGESKPIAPNTIPEGRAKNRRTIFLIYEK